MIRVDSIIAGWRAQADRIEERGNRQDAVGTLRGCAEDIERAQSENLAEIETRTLPTRYEFVGGGYLVKVFEPSKATEHVGWSDDGDCQIEVVNGIFGDDVFSWDERDNWSASDLRKAAAAMLAAADKIEELRS